jgi:hypothetical protein
MNIPSSQGDILNVVFSIPEFKLLRESEPLDKLIHETVSHYWNTDEDLTSLPVFYSEYKKYDRRTKCFDQWIKKWTKDLSGSDPKTILTVRRIFMLIFLCITAKRKHSNTDSNFDPNHRVVFHEILETDGIKHWTDIKEQQHEMKLLTQFYDWIALWMQNFGAKAMHDNLFFIVGYIVYESIPVTGGSPTRRVQNMEHVYKVALDHLSCESPQALSSTTSSVHEEIVHGSIGVFKTESELGDDLLQEAMEVVLHERSEH